MSMSPAPEASSAEPANADLRQRLLGPPLAGFLAGRDNHFNLVRVIAALAVLVSHAFALTTGNEALEPLRASTGTSLGYYAVGVFFGISGLLIARSFDRRASIWHFLASRVLRLWPALVLVLVLTAVVIGPLLTKLDNSDYFADPRTWIYVPANLSLAFLSDELPGVFLDNPFALSVNGSLWTLFYEVVCYGGVVVTGYLGLLRRRWLFAVFLALVLAGNIAAVLTDAHGGLSGRLDLLGLLGLPFALGMAAYVWREQLRLGPVIAAILWLACLPFAATPFFSSAITVALVYTVLWLALVPKGPLLGYNRVGDYSYGVYIFAFPTQQTMIALFPGQGPLANVLLSTPVVLILAVASWKLVEARSLALARPLGDRIAAIMSSRLEPAWWMPADRQP